MEQEKHIEEIKKQFNLQADSYSKVKAHSDSLDLLIRMSKVSTEDNVLDVACGSGIVACEFAHIAKGVTGVDITENMLEQARMLQLQHGLNNVNWIMDDVLPLKFPDNHFSVVVTRFSFHHFIDYEKVFKEMIRVCKPGGRVMVVDVSVPEEKTNAYDMMEKLRDPSHASVLSIESFASLFKHPQLINCQSTSYNLEIELENQLNASYPKQEDKQKLRDLITKDVNINNLGIYVEQVDGIYNLNYPILIYCAEKTGSPN